MATTYGLTDQGFVRARLPEIRQQIIDDQIARLRAAGLPDEPETRPDSVLGIQIDSFAERYAEFYELLEGLYLGWWPSSAEGVMLQHAVSLSGVTRLGEIKASAYIVLYGVPGTVVPGGTVIRNAVTNVQYATNADSSIGAYPVDLTISVRSVQPNTTYTITLNGVERSITSSTPATASGIIAALAGVMLPPANVVVSTTDSTLRIRATTAQHFNYAISTNLGIDRIGSLSGATATQAIAEQADAGTLTGIVTFVDGLTAVDNLLPGTAGRAAETDAELRARYAGGVYRLGAGTPASIRANLLANVPGITYVTLQENVSDVYDEFNNLPHSIRVIADGGTDIAIANEIERVKGAGIDTNGAVSQSVLDSEGVAHTIRFDRAAPVYVWVEADITTLPTAEQAFPSNGNALVAAAIVAAGNSFGIGSDVVYQRLESAALKVSGVAYAYVKVWGTLTPGLTPPAGALGSQNLVIAANQVARFDLSRVTVV